MSPGHTGHDDYAELLAKGTAEAVDAEVDAAESSDVSVIKQVLSADEIALCFRAGEAIGAEPSMRKRTACGFVYDVHYDREAHTALCKCDSDPNPGPIPCTYHSGPMCPDLHRGGYISHEWSCLLRKLVEAMRGQPGEWGEHDAELQVIEN